MSWLVHFAYLCINFNREIWFDAGSSQYSKTIFERGSLTYLWNLSQKKNLLRMTILWMNVIYIKLVPFRLNELSINTIMSCIIFYYCWCCLYYLLAKDICFEDWSFILTVRVLALLYITGFASYTWSRVKALLNVCPLFTVELPPALTPFFLWQF